MNFTTPIAFILILTLPYFFWLGRPRRKGPRSWRDWSSLTLRIVIMTLLLLTLAGTQIVRAADTLAVAFLLDVSDSMQAEQIEAAELFIREAISEMGPNDQAAVILFGANALVERPMSGLAELAPVSSVPQTLHTDLAEAIQLGMALFPAGHARRIVLLTDGQATVGDTRSAAQLAAQSGVEISYVPLITPPGKTEAMLVNVQAPSRITQGDQFNIQVTIQSSHNMPAQLRIIAGGVIVTDQAITLNRGITTEILTLRATAEEFTRYTVQLVPAEDTYFQNNELAAFTDVAGPPRILLVSSGGTIDDQGNPIPDDSPQLHLALTAVGLTVDKISPAELPATIEQISNYAAIVLVNVNAKYLSPRKMETLQLYVRDLGGGLVVVGGPESYGMGGYFETALEETLPVNMQIKDEERFPAVSIAIVIDRSGSMGAQEGGATKIQLAAEGAVRVVQLLNSTDYIAVIPVDTRPSNPIGPVSAADKENVINAIRRIGAGGGGIYVRAGLEAAASALGQTPSPVKHIIVLADGADSEQKEGVPELIDALTAEGVTISMVSIGDGPDVPWLRQMAERGNGRFHFTDRAANLPQIFTQETTNIQRSYLVEERFFPTLGPAGNVNPILQFLLRDSAGAQVPPLHGYVGTSAKGTAQVLLQTHKEDPLLAAWQYGLGRSVAWTSDATGRWGTDWVSWSAFPGFWARVVQWTVSESRDNLVESRITLNGDEAHLVVDLKDDNGQFLNNMQMQTNIISPEGETISLLLSQSAPGRYEARFEPQEEGAYFIRIAGESNDAELSIGQTTGWVLGYSPEYRQFEPSTALLETVATLTNGQDLTDKALDVFAHTLPPPDDTTRPIWTMLLLMALLLLPFDIAVRRLVITRRDWERASAFLFGRFRRRQPVVKERSAQVSRLFEAKERASRQTSDTASQSDPSLPPQSAPQPTTINPPLTSAATPDEKQKPPPGKPGSGHLAGRLLRKKQSRDVSED